MAESPALRVYLVRHGETAWSLTGQHTGRTDIALTAHGEDEARELEPWLGGIRFGRVFTSPRQRARRTCELAGLGQAMEIEPDLAEWDYGEYEGRLSSDIHAGRPGWNVFRDGCPGGEMPADVGARADRVIAKLAALDGSVAVFSHGHMGLVLAARWIGQAVLEGQHFMLGTATLSILGYNPAHPATPVIDLWNASPAMLRPGGKLVGPPLTPGSEETTMFKLIEGMPPGVLAIEASGKVTHDDYRDMLIPLAEAMIAKGPIRMLCVIGKDFTGFELAALWDDGRFGLKHWHDFSHIAVVTDNSWLGATVSMFRPFFHGDVRLFGLADLPAAKDWITGGATPVGT